MSLPFEEKAIDKEKITSILKRLIENVYYYDGCTDKTICLYCCCDIENEKHDESCLYIEASELLNELEGQENV